jgi:hypothetical protein
MPSLPHNTTPTRMRPLARPPLSQAAKGAALADALTAAERQLADARNELDMVRAVSCCVAAGVCFWGGRVACRAASGSSHGHGMTRRLAGVSGCSRRLHPLHTQALTAATATATEHSDRAQVRRGCVVMGHEQQLGCLAAKPRHHTTTRASHTLCVTVTPL